jgi:hypothetical protein
LWNNVEIEPTGYAFDVFKDARSSKPWINNMQTVSNHYTCHTPILFVNTLDRSRKHTCCLDNTLIHAVHPNVMEEDSV